MSAATQRENGEDATPVSPRPRPTAGQPAPEPEAELAGLFPLIRRWFVVILVATAIATLIGFVLAARATPTYEARAELLVGPLNSDLGTVVAAGRVADTYVQLVSSRAILEPLVRELEIDRTTLYSGVRATANAKSRVLEVRARAHTAEDAAAIANGVANGLVRSTPTDPGDPGRLQVVDVATPPSSPISPRVALIVPLAAVAGLLGSLALVMVLELVGDTAASVKEVEAATGARAVAVGRGRGRARPRIGTVVAAELDLVRPDARCVLLAGVSGRDQGGRVALEVAAAWGPPSSTVTVVDGGPGEVTLAMGLGGRPGLQEALAGESDVETTALSETVQVLGTGRGEPDEVLDLDQAGILLAGLQADGGRVVVHAGSAISSGIALGWARLADATVLVARRDQARRGQLEEIATNLRAMGTDLAFSVLHDGPQRPPRGELVDPGPDRADAPVQGTGR